MRMPGSAGSRSCRTMRRSSRRFQHLRASSASRSRTPKMAPCGPRCCATRSGACRDNRPWIPMTVLVSEGGRSMRTKHTFRLPPDLAGQLADYAHRKRVPQALVVETALSSYLSPDNSERMEAALGRRLDRLTRQVERLERHVTISNEALALFVRFWLTGTPPLPDTAQAAAQAKGRERYQGYIEALGRRLAKGQTLAGEISQDLPSRDDQPDETAGTP